VGIRSLDVWVEGVAGGNVGEGGSGWGVESPPLREDDYLSELGTRHRVAGAEGAIVVAGNREIAP